RDHTRRAARPPHGGHSSPGAGRARARGDRARALRRRARDPDERRAGAHRGPAARSRDRRALPPRRPERAGRQLPPAPPARPGPEPARRDRRVVAPGRPRRPALLTVARRAAQRLTVPPPAGRDLRLAVDGLSLHAVDYREQAVSGSALLPPLLFLHG